MPCLLFARKASFRKAATLTTVEAGAQMRLERWWCNFWLCVLLVVFVGCHSDSPVRNVQEVSGPTGPRVLEVDDPIRGRIHDVFLKTYQPISYIVEHPGQSPETAIQRFLNDRQDTGFTTTSFDQCPACYSFVIDFEISDLSGRAVQQRCAPTIDLRDGTVIEWNSECPRFFKPTRQVRPAKVRFTNEFVGLEGEAKKQMDEYMLLARGTNPPDEQSELDKVPQVKCQDFTHTCFLIVRDTLAGHFEWLYDASVRRLSPENGLAKILELRDRAATQGTAK
jgi:hypothetical protein